MYNLLLAGAISVVAFLLPLLGGLPWYTGFAPAGLTFPIVAFLLMRRTTTQIQGELAPVQGMMMALQGESNRAKAEQVLAEVRTLLEDVKVKYARWQILLEGQMDAQIGFLDYMRLDFDAAMPRLQAAWRDWNADVAIACILLRRNETDAAWAKFADAESSGSKEPVVYAMHAIHRNERGMRKEALEALTRGLEATGGNALLRDLKNKLANKQKLDPTVLGDTWYRFHPETMVQQAMVRGRRGPPPAGMAQQMVQGPPQPKLRGKLARRR